MVNFSMATSEAKRRGERSGDSSIHPLIIVLGLIMQCGRRNIFLVNNQCSSIMIRKQPTLSAE
jgi:hypothetical protein